MSEEEKVEETTEEMTEATEGETKKELPEMTCGYVVGLEPDGQFVFEILGTQPGLAQLLGLHEFAKIQINAKTEQGLQYGFPVLAQAMGQVMNMMKVMLNMLTEQQKKDESTIVTP